jgi:putative tricarboxylic transport membrane protein
MEAALRQSLQISRGEFSIFFTRPISLTFLIIATVIVVSSVVGSRFKRRAHLPVDVDA